MTVMSAEMEKKQTDEMEEKQTEKKPLLIRLRKVSEGAMAGYSQSRPLFPTRAIYGLNKEHSDKIMKEFNKTKKLFSEEAYYFDDTEEWEIKRFEDEGGSSSNAAKRGECSSRRSKRRSSCKKEIPNKTRIRSDDETEDDTECGYKISTDGAGLHKKMKKGKSGEYQQKGESYERSHPQGKSYLSQMRGQVDKLVHIPIVQPIYVRRSDNGSIRKDNMASVMDLLLHLSDYGRTPCPYYRFIINPNSYKSTLQNMKVVGDLFDEYFISTLVGEFNSLFIKPMMVNVRNKERREECKKARQRKPFIDTMSIRFWQYLKDELETTSAIIPDGMLRNGDSPQYDLDE